MDYKKFLIKLQNLPDTKKKIILWTIVVVLAGIMGFFWVQSAMNNFKKIGEGIGQIELPQIETPAIEILQTASPSNENAIK
jgi:hypothetical protein